MTRTQAEKILALARQVEEVLSEERKQNGDVFITFSGLVEKAEMYMEGWIAGRGGQIGEN